MAWVVEGKTNVLKSAQRPSGTKFSLNPHKKLVRRVFQKMLTMQRGGMRQKTVWLRTISNKGENEMGGL